MRGVRVLFNNTHTHFPQRLKIKYFLKNKNN